MKKNLLIFVAVLGTLSLTAIGFMNWTDTSIVSQETGCQPTCNSSEKASCQKEGKAEHLLTSTSTCKTADVTACQESPSSCQTSQHTGCQPANASTCNSAPTCGSLAGLEQEALFVCSHASLLSYLRTNSKDQVSIVEDENLDLGIVSFVVTSEGEVSNIRVDSTSGFPTLDSDFVQLISNMPANWTPALSALGQPIDQEFIFYFGPAGC